jgi:hypothetical protein
MLGFRMLAVKNSPKRRLADSFGQNRAGKINPPAAYNASSF